MAMIDPETLFSPDYPAARAAFLAAAAQAGARVRSVEHPFARGPGGTPLHMDRAVLGDPDAPAALCVISGTHGPEGYAGSAVQTGLLRSGLAQRYAERQRVILIHAHNPYGFAWDTRFNEDNIDLNRNYLASFAPPLPANPGYEAVAAWAARSRVDGICARPRLSSLAGCGLGWAVHPSQGGVFRRSGPQLVAHHAHRAAERSGGWRGAAGQHRHPHRPRP